MFCNCDCRFSCDWRVLAVSYSSGASPMLRSRRFIQRVVSRPDSEYVISGNFAVPNQRLLPSFTT